MLRNSSQPPTTSAPPPSRFLEAYRKAGQRAANVLCITLSGKFSGTFNSAKLAAGMAKDTLKGISVEVLDSRMVAAAEGLVVMTAGRAAALGKNMAGVIKAAKSTMDSVHLLGMLDTISYLARSGRVPKAAAWAGAMLKLRPIVILKGGGGAYRRQRQKLHGGR